MCQPEPAPADLQRGRPLESCRARHHSSDRLPSLYAHHTPLPQMPRAEALRLREPPAQPSVLHFRRDVPHHGRGARGRRDGRRRSALRRASTKRAGTPCMCSTASRSSSIETSSSMGALISHLLSGRRRTACIDWRSTCESECPTNERTTCRRRRVCHNADTGMSSPELVMLRGQQAAALRAMVSTSPTRSR
jgi:hypothetical protein